MKKESYVEFFFCHLCKCNNSTLRHVSHVLSAHNEVKLHCNKNVQLMTSFFFLTSSHTCDGVKKSASSCQTTLGI